LILAGILDTQFPAVHKVYSRAGMKLVAQKKDAEWRSAAFILTQRRGPAITPGN
jgi:ribosomal protein L11 methylase PrmA